jgi:hypothetical protein
LRPPRAEGPFPFAAHAKKQGRDRSALIILKALFREDLTAKAGSRARLIVIIFDDYFLSDNIKWISLVAD